MKGPTKKEEPPQKLVARIEYIDTKVCKAGKRVILSSIGGIKTPSAPATYDEAKACLKARKRKERQESISSLCQERKVIRSNSEERPIQKKYIENKNNIRRVSSSGDFPKSASIEKLNVSPNRGTTAEKTLAYEDYEHERRRSHERFARPLTLKNRKHPNKRLKVRYVSKTKYKPELPNENREYAKKTNVPQGTYSNNHPTNDTRDFEIADKKLDNFLQLHKVEKDRSPSPIHTPVSPVLDFSTLHEQVDCSEPLLSCPSRQLNENTETLPSLSVASNRLLSSPRNSIIATHRIYLDPDVPQMNVTLEKKSQNPFNERLQKLNKKINSLKKKIKNAEIDFEERNGFKPSHVDKLNDKAMKTLYADLSKLKKEQKQLSDVSVNCSMTDFSCKSPVNGSSSVDLHVTVNEIEQKLTQKRGLAKRSYNIEDMTSEQLLDEKIAIQKALLYLESIHGRPNSKEDRNIVRPFYDRYRIMKRMISKISTTNPKGNELETIDENQTMHFVTTTSSSNDTESEQTESIQAKPKTSIVSSNSTDSESDTSLSENLHSLSKAELTQQLKIVVEEKKELRRSIKEFEMELQTKTGRMIQREDKLPMENVYTAYKKTKAKLRLLEALVGKQ